MASLWFTSFDWDAFNRLLVPPATQLAQRVVRRIGTRRPRDFFPELPRVESELVSRVAELLSAEDWYAGKSPDEARSMDGLAQAVFDRPLKELKAKTLMNGGGVMDDVLLVATGVLEVIPRPKGARRGGLYVRLKDRNDQERTNLPALRPRPRRRVNEGLTELEDLGSRPHRHPGWDREEAAKLYKANNPFNPSSRQPCPYLPDYSIHSPKQVNSMLEWLLGVRDAFRDAEDEMRVHVEDELYRPFETAARSGLAIYARPDY